MVARVHRFFKQRVAPHFDFKHHPVRASVNLAIFAIPLIGHYLLPIKIGAEHKLATWRNRDKQTS